MNKRYQIKLLGRLVTVGSYPDPELAERPLTTARAHREAIKLYHRQIESRLYHPSAQTLSPENLRLLVHSLFHLPQAAARFMRTQRRKGWPDIPTPAIEDLPWTPRHDQDTDR